MRMVECGTEWNGGGDELNFLFSISFDFILAAENIINHGMRTQDGE